MHDLTGNNLDAAVVRGFSDEWSRFDQSRMPEDDALELFEAYFDLVPWNELSDAICADIGCGSGRWAVRVAQRVRVLHCMDAAPAAAEVAKRTLRPVSNCHVVCGTIGELPFPENSLDFAYSLGVLHHLPDPLEGLRVIVRAVKAGAPVLVYLYYAFDGRPMWFRVIWRMSDALRRIVSVLPRGIVHRLADALAIGVYWPLARLARLVEMLGISPEGMPLNQYRRRSFYVMRTDSLDRFGTRLEHRFTRHEVEEMMRDAGLVDIRLREASPYWVAIGRKADGSHPR